MLDKTIMVFAIVAGVVLFILLGLLIIVRIRRQRPLPMDELEGHDFEYYCADLLREHGFLDVEVTKGSGDFGADILAEKDGAHFFDDGVEHEFFAEQ